MAVSNKKHASSDVVSSSDLIVVTEGSLVHTVLSERCDRIWAGMHTYYYPGKKFIALALLLKQADL